MQLTRNLVAYAAIAAAAVLPLCVIWETSLLLALGCRKKCDIPTADKIVPGTLASFQLSYRLPIWGDALYRFFAVVGAWVIWPVWRWVLLVWEVSSAVICDLWYALVRAVRGVFTVLPSFLTSPLTGFIHGADEYVIGCMKLARKSLPELPFWVALTICVLIIGIVAWALLARYYFHTSMLAVAKRFGDRVDEDNTFCGAYAVLFMVTCFSILFLQMHVSKVASGEL